MNSRQKAKLARLARRLPQPKRIASRDSGALLIRSRVVEGWLSSKHEPARKEVAVVAHDNAMRRTFKGVYSEPARRVLAEIGAQRRRAGR